MCANVNYMKNSKEHLKVGKLLWLQYRSASGTASETVTDAVMWSIDVILLIIVNMSDIKKALCTFEVVDVYVHRAGFNTGSRGASNEFFSDFIDLLEGLATYSAPLMILGDFNIHTDDATSGPTE